jgi:hypothetical protein
MSDLDLDDPDTEIESVSFDPNSRGDDEEQVQYPDVTGLLEEYGVDDVELTRTARFFELRMTGVEPALAALEVGWSLRQLRQKERDPYFGEIMVEITQGLVEAVEGVAVRKALAGNTEMIKLFLYNRSPDRWRDVRRIVDERHDTPVEQIAASVTAGVLAAIRESGVRSMQSAFVPPAIEAASTVVDDADRSETG